MANNKKTNKTSHVMNLLTNGAGPETEGSAEASASGAPSSPESAAPEKKGDVQSHTVTPKKVTVVDEGSRNDRLSQEILSKLSEELDEEADGAAAPAPSEAEALGIEPQAGANLSEAASDLAPANPPEAAAASQAPVNPPEAMAASQAQANPPEAVAASQASAGQAPEAGSASEEVFQEAEADHAAPAQAAPSKAHHAIIPKSQLGSNLLNDQYSFVNIMEQLILRQDINSYLEQYNVCKCPRCMADVCALALSGMPPKYVVTSKDSISPLLSYYESRNKILMLTELIKACNKVRENPRHEKR